MKNLKILLTGSTGLVGKALHQQLLQKNYHVLAPTHQVLDLRVQQNVFAYFEANKPDYVFHLAAMVGGIHANKTYPAKFIYDNTQMHCNVIEASHRYGVQKLLFPGSSCTYPKLAPQPIKESSFLDGFVEETNIGYAAAKINGLVMCQSYAKEYGLRVVLPMATNAYGIGDHFHPEHSHVIPALLQRFYQAKIENLSSVTLWGSGKPVREFIYMDDMAAAFIFLMEQYESSELINVGTSVEISIADLAKEIAQIVGFKGEILFDTSKPDGPLRKCVDSSKIFALGFKPQVSLSEGLRRTFAAQFKVAEGVSA